MSELAIIQNQSTIKSTELVDIINDFRKAEGKETELNHNDFMKKIRKEVETLSELGIKGQGNFSQSSYINSQNKEQPCFELNRDGMLQMLNSESTFVRYKTIEYINKLEQKIEQLKPTCIEDVLISSLQEMKDMRLQLQETKAKVEIVEQKANEAKEELQGIREVVSINSTDWKKDTATLISKMALKLGGFEHISDLRKESYNLLHQKTGVKLETRLTNKRRRMADEGVCKSKRDKLNYIDIIAEDKKELEVYLGIVKEMAIKYGV